MDRLMLAEKLESLRRAVARIEQRRVDSADTLASDVDAQDILALNLTRAAGMVARCGGRMPLASRGATRLPTGASWRGALGRRLRPVARCRAPRAVAGQEVASRVLRRRRRSHALARSGRIVSSWTRAKSFRLPVTRSRP